MRWLAACLGTACLLTAQTPSPRRLRADIAFLASDLLEGRAPGTRGDQLTAEYLYAQFAALDAKVSYQEVLHGALKTRNVIAVIPGSDPAAAQESVIFTAHMDHLGVTAGLGDQIHNGAADNATGLAALLEAARLWSALDPHPARTAIFIATAAGEAAQAGVKAYVAAPVLPLESARVHLDLHNYPPIGRTRDIIVAGGESSPLWPTLSHAIERFGFEARSAPVPPPDPEAGNFASHLVPSFTLQPGTGFTGNLEAKAALAVEYQTRILHSPADEYSPDWDISGLEQITRIAVELGLSIANLPVRGD